MFLPPIKAICPTTKLYERSAVKTLWGGAGKGRGGGGGGGGETRARKRGREA